MVRTKGRNLDVMCSHVTANGENLITGVERMKKVCDEDCIAG